MAERRYLELAVDAAGVAGGRTYTYHAGSELDALTPGEAVLVEYGRRRALAIVVAETGRPAIETKPVLERVRSDGPILPPLQIALARHIANHYLAPPALVIRAMLPPGHLERLDLVAYAGRGDDDETDDLVTSVRDGGAAGVRVRDLRVPEARPQLMRRLRRLAADGLVRLEWTLLPPSVRPRVRRVAALTTEGAIVADAIAAGGGAAGAGPKPRLGHRQRSLLLELRDVGEGEAPRLAERHGGGTLKALADRGLVSIRSEEVPRRPLEDRVASGHRARPVASALTPPQASVVERVQGLIAGDRHGALLLDGVTGGGKTAVYAEAIGAALAADRGAIVLVPEIALAAPLLDRLASETNEDVALVHSALSEGERTDEFARTRAGRVRVVVGTRLAVLAPMARVGVVIVDEEHDAAYKSDRTPRYQARDVALELGRLASCPVILGSATPDVASVGRAERGELERIRLPERLSGRPPRVDAVDLRAELAAGNQGLLSAALVQALTQLDVEQGDRAILLINRRGTATIVLCRDCGYVQICPECRRPLVFHAAGLALRCHHCGASAPVARRCPACGSPRIRYLGGGTERVEREVRIRFPALRVGRLDRDVVERKGAAVRVVDAFAGGDLDVLVGTSLVAKGLDVPAVTLVGVVSADVALNLPDERAAERTFQLLAQAVGRAGRGVRDGRALIQSYQPNHPAIRAVVTGEHDSFYAAELELRRAFRSPPFGSLVKLTIAHEDHDTARREAASMADTLRARASEAGRDTVVLGPAPAYIARRGGRWRFNVILRGTDPAGTLGGDPGAPWSIDVDPETLL